MIQEVSLTQPNRIQNHQVLAHIRAAQVHQTLASLRQLEDLCERD